MNEAHKRSTNYAGIAALITAVTGGIGLLISQMSYETKNQAVQESVLLVVQYRIEKLERVVENQDREVVNLRIKLAARLGHRFLPDGPQFDAEPSPAPVGVSTPPPPLGKPEGRPTSLEYLVDKVLGKSPVRMQDIQQLVEQRGAPLERSDLGQ